MLAVALAVIGALVVPSPARAADDIEITAPADGSPVRAATRLPDQRASVNFLHGTTASHLLAECRTGSWRDDVHFELRTFSGTLLSSGRCEPYANWAVDLVRLPSEALSLVLIPAAGKQLDLTVTMKQVPNLERRADLIGTPVTVKPTVVDQNALVDFDAESGDRIYVDCRAESGYTIELLDPSGVELKPAGSLRQCAFSTTYRSAFDAVTLPRTGTYTLVLNYSYNHRVNTESSVRVFRLPADSTAPVTVDGTPATPAITVPGQNARLTFTLEQGQSAYIACWRTGKPTVVTSVLDPAGARVDDFRTCRADAAAGSTPDPSLGTVVEAKTPGTYTLLLNPADDLIGSPAVVRVYAFDTDVSATVGVDGEPVSAQTATPGQAARIAFTLTEPTAVIVECRFSGVPNGATAGIDERPAFNDMRRFLGQCGTSDFAPVLQTYKLAPGTYHVTVDPKREYTGEVAVRVRPEPAPAQVTAAVDGTAVTVAATEPGQDAVVSFVIRPDHGYTVTCVPTDATVQARAYLTAPSGYPATRGEEVCRTATPKLVDRLGFGYGAQGTATVTLDNWGRPAGYTVTVTENDWS
jgi:hypothetical protein